MLRALNEYEITELKTLIPFHQALLATEQWARGETCRDLVEDRKWLKQLAFPKAEKPAGGRRARCRRVEQDYTVEVSGRRFEVKVIGPPRRRGERRGAAGAAAGRASRSAASGAGGAGGGGGGDALVSPLQGTVLKVAVEQGAAVDEGALDLRHRGDEDGERDHGAQGRDGARSCRLFVGAVGCLGDLRL